MPWTDLLNNLECPLPDRFAEYAKVLSADNPMLYWYPCSSNDLTPLVLDTADGADGFRLFPLRGTAGSLVLWMNDNGSLSSVYNYLQSADQATAGSYTLKEALTQFRASLTPVDGGCHKTRIRVCRNFASDPEYIPVEFILVTITNQGYTGKRQRPDGGDTYLVVYGNIDSRYLFRQVFCPMSLRVKVGAIIHPGWSEYPDGPTNHYEIVPQVLAFMRSRYRNEPVLLTDNRKDTWGSDFFENRCSTVTWTGVDVNKYSLKDGIGVITVDPDNPAAPRWLRDPAEEEG